MARIGLDTNVALRWLLTGLGDGDQERVAGDAVVAMADRVHINLVVLAEFMWMLGHTAKLGRDRQILLLRGLLDNPRVTIADRAAVSDALDAFERGGAGFVDHLIGILNRAEGCETTLTFDKVAAKSPEFTLLT